MIQIMHEHSYNLNPTHEWFNQDVTSYVQLEIQDDPSMDIWPPPHDEFYCDFTSDLQSEPRPESDKDRIQEEHSYNLSYVSSTNKSDDNSNIEIGSCAANRNYIEEEYCQDISESYSDFCKGNGKTEHNFSDEVIQQIQQEHLYNLRPPCFEITLDGKIQLKGTSSNNDEYDFEMLDTQEPEFSSDYISEEMKQEIINRLTSEAVLSDQEEDSNIKDMDISTFVRICQYEEKAFKEIDESFSIRYEACTKDDHEC